MVWQVAGFLLFNNQIVSTAQKDQGERVDREQEREREERKGELTIWLLIWEYLILCRKGNCRFEILFFFVRCISVHWSVFSFSNFQFNAEFRLRVMRSLEQPTNHIFLRLFIPHTHTHNFIHLHTNRLSDFLSLFHLNGLYRTDNNLYSL